MGVVLEILSYDTIINQLHFKQQHIKKNKYKQDQKPTGI